ncbi:MAG: glycosyltransferase family 4 protein [Hydrogenophaga sp.]|nr:glycosyltransferase family 4 protein [Hydrogenophaga sp.]
MKVWYVSAYDQPRGQSTRTYDFSRELVRRGHEVTMFTNGFCHFTHTDRLRPDEQWRVEMVDGIRVVWLKTRPYRGNGGGRGLNMLDNVRRILQVSKVLGDQPDVVLGPSVPTLTGWAAARLAQRYRVPFIFEVRDVWPDALVDIGGLSRSSPVYHAFRHLEKMLYRKAQRISSTLPHLSEHVADSGSDPGKIVCIPNGVDLSPYTPDVAYDGGEGRQLVVMYVGGFGLDHDVPTIIRAAKLLQDAGDTTFRFIVIGGGVRKAAAEAEVRSYKLRNLELREPIPKSSIPEVQRGADILVAAITDSKSYRFGLNLNKLCAYFASARPVLFSGNPPNDPVHDSGAGLSVGAEDPQAMVAGLRELAARGAGERIEMGARGRQYAQTTLSMEALGARMEDMLTSAIEEYRARS